MEFSILGAWGLAVLIASVTGTQYVKKWMKENGMQSNWYFVCIPFLIAGVGSLALAIGKQITWEMAPLFWFVLGFGGNAIYRLWKARK